MSNERFSRRESPTQTKEDALLQVKSGEVWGRAARGGDILSVKAYRRKLAADERGIEFTTSVAPHRGSGSPNDAFWYYPNTPGVLLRRRALDNEEFAAIPANVINLQP
jgi:hypothetical protein